MFKSFFKIEFKRTFFRWQTLAAFIVFMAIFIHISIMDKIDIPTHATYPKILALECGNCFNSYLQALAGPSNSYMLLIFPLIISLFIGDSLFLDYKTGFFNFTITRVDLKTYIKFKTIAVSLVSFIISFLFQVMAFGYSFFTSPYYLPSGKIGPRDMILPSMGYSIYVNHPFIYVFIVMIIFSIVATTIAALGLITSNKFKSTLKVIIAPWIIYLFVGMFLMMISSGSSILYRVSPIQLSGANIFGEEYNLIFVFLYWIFLISILYFISCRLFFKKFKKGN